MLSRTATRSLSRRAQPAISVLSTRLQDVLSPRRVAKASNQCRIEPCARTFASPSSTKLSPPVALQRLETLEDCMLGQNADFVKSALQVVLNMREGVSKKVITQEELGQRLEAFQVVLREARQCIEDCADSAESDDFDEETMNARSAVEEACASFADIIDDLEGVEKSSDSYPFGVVKRSEFVRLSQGTKVEKLKEELAVIMREWRSPPFLRPVD